MLFVKDTSERKQMNDEKRHTTINKNKISLNLVKNKY